MHMSNYNKQAHKEKQKLHPPKGSAKNIISFTEREQNMENLHYTSAYRDLPLPLKLECFSQKHSPRS